MLAVTLINNQRTSGTVFFAAKNLSHAYPTAAAAKQSNYVGNHLFDCSAGFDIEDVETGITVGERRYSGAKENGVRTLFFELAPFQTRKIYFPPHFNAEDATVWFVPVFASVRSGNAAAGPEKMSAVKLNILASSVSYSISNTDGVSCGITVIDDYGDNVGEKTRACVPESPLNVYNVQVDRSGGFPTVVSTKHSVANSGNAFLESLATCEGALGETACGQHRCRVYYKLLEDTGTSYCNWLRREKAETLCWKFDDLECVDSACGYRDDGIGAPRQLTNDGLGNEEGDDNFYPGLASDNCDVPDPVDRGEGVPPLWAANVYSCGFGTSLAKPKKFSDDDDLVDGKYVITQTGTEMWWKPVTVGAVSGIGPGCIRKQVLDNKSISRTMGARSGKTISIIFSNLPWLTGKPTLVKTLVENKDVKNTQFFDEEGSSALPDTDITTDFAKKSSVKHWMGVIISFIIVVAVIATVCGYMFDARAFSMPVFTNAHRFLAKSAPALAVPLS